MSTSHDTKLVFFSSKADKHQKKISLSIPAMIPKDKIQYCSTINELSLAIHKMVLGYSIILLLIRNRAELEEVLKLRNLLQGKSIILILETTKEEILRRGLKLYPRYTTEIKSDYSDIAFVMKKLLTKF